MVVFFCLGKGEKGKVVCGKFKTEKIRCRKSILRAKTYRVYFEREKGLSALIFRGLCLFEFEVTEVFRSVKIGGCGAYGIVG